MKDVALTGLAVLLSIGSGGAIVLLLSGWLGRVWSARIMQDERAAHERALTRLEVDLQSRQAIALEALQTELEIAKSKLLSAHYNKVLLCRQAMDVIAPMVASIGLLAEGRVSLPTEFRTYIVAFERDRLQAYGYLAMFAPQSVMDPFDEIIDHLMNVIDETASFDFRLIRASGLRMINAVRVDLGVDPSPIAYHGLRQ
jgi:hypothetical protein